MLDEVDFPSWEKLDIRVGKITSVEEIPDADKLYKLEVDIGEHRVLVAGLKKHYKADDLIGKQVVVLANLEKKKLKGIESQGMILAAVNEDFRNLHNKEISDSARESLNSRHEGKIKLLIPDEDIEPGSKVR